MFKKKDICQRIIQIIIELIYYKKNLEMLCL